MSKKTFSVTISNELKNRISENFGVKEIKKMVHEYIEKTISYNMTKGRYRYIIWYLDNDSHVVGYVKANNMVHAKENFRNVYGDKKVTHCFRDSLENDPYTPKIELTLFKW